MEVPSDGEDKIQIEEVALGSSKTAERGGTAKIWGVSLSHM